MVKVVILLVISLGTLWTPAEAWTLDAMNRTINQTNFILDDQCSATLISVRLRLVLTNYHCIDAKITIEERDEVAPTGEIKKVRRSKVQDVVLAQKAYAGSEQVGAASFLADIVAWKKRADLALLRIKADTIPMTVESPLLPDGRAVQRGARVYIVGNPRMLDASVVEGIISSTTRVFEVPWAENERVPFYQVSGGLTGGNSGGALYDNDGFLIGVPAAGFPEGHLGLAVTVDAVKGFLRDACYQAAWDAKAPSPEVCLADRQAKLKR